MVQMVGSSETFWWSIGRAVWERWVLNLIMLKMEDFIKISHDINMFKALRWNLMIQQMHQLELVVVIAVNQQSLIFFSRRKKCQKPAIAAFLLCGIYVESAINWYNWQTDNWRTNINIAQINTPIHSSYLNRFYSWEDRETNEAKGKYEHFLFVQFQEHMWLN